MRFVSDREIELKVYRFHDEVRTLALRFFSFAIVAAAAAAAAAGWVLLLFIFDRVPRLDVCCVRVGGAAPLVLGRK